MYIDLQQRPNYLRSQNISPQLFTPRTTKTHTKMGPMTDRIAPSTSSFRRKFIFPTPKQDDRLQIEMQQRKNKVAQAYNLISDFNDKRQISVSLKQLDTAKERIMLVDKIFERREEMQLATLKYKAKKLEPIFDVIRRKLKHRTIAGSPDQKSQSSMSPSPITPRKQQHKTMTHIPEEELTEEQKELLLKLQQKFTANLAISWLTRVDKKKSEILDSPASARRRKRRNSMLQVVKNSNVNVIQHKVSEISEELIRAGQSRFIQNPIAKKKSLTSIHSKVDCHFSLNKNKILIRRNDGSNK